MSQYRNEAHKYLSSLSDEQFYGLLEDAGFELEDGDGKIIFTDDVEQMSLQVQIKSSFKLKVNEDHSPSINKTYLTNKLASAC